MTNESYMQQQWTNTHQKAQRGGQIYPEAEADIVIDWLGRTAMQIHSSRLMFCHPALSAIK